MATINGRAKRYDGKAVDYILIFKWNNGQFLSKIVPDKAGYWSFSYYVNTMIGITYVSDGCEAITHGSYELVVSK